MIRRAFVPSVAAAVLGLVFGAAVVLAADPPMLPNCNCTSRQPATGPASCSACSGMVNLRIGCGPCCEGSACSQTDAPGGGGIT